jgi:hypothetical protein
MINDIFLKAKKGPPLPSDCDPMVNCKNLTEKVCYAFETGEVWVQLTYFGNQSQWSNVFFLAVAVFNLWFASVIWRNKSLQAHPMKLFMYIALTDALYYSNQFFVYNTCKIRLPQLISYTIFYDYADYYYQYRALFILVISQ